MQEPQELVVELAEYLRKRHEKCKEAVAFLVGDKNMDFLPYIYMMWERDFYRDKLLSLREAIGADKQLFKA